MLKSRLRVAICIVLIFSLSDLFPTQSSIKAWAQDDWSQNSQLVSYSATSSETLAIPSDIANLVNDTYSNASTILTKYKQQGAFNWRLADGNSGTSSAKVTALTVDGIDGWVYAGLEVPKGATIVVYTNDSVPYISDMQIGYYTGRTLQYADGTSEQEICWIDPSNPKDSDSKATISARGGTIRLALQLKWSTGNWVNVWSDSSVSNSDFSWYSSDSNIAQIFEHTKDGTVTACGTSDGQVTVSVSLTNSAYLSETAKNNGGLKKEITVNLQGQSGAYPEEVQIVDENCTAIGDGGVYLNVNNGDLEFQPYVRITYNDGEGNITYKCNAPYCASGNHEHVLSPNKIDGLSWDIASTSSTQDILDIDSVTGCVAPYYGMAGKVQIRANVLGNIEGTISGTAWIIVQGDLTSKAADTLTVQVVYEDYPDQIVSSETFDTSTLSQVSENGYSISYYTQVKKDQGGNYRTVSGYGVSLKDLFAYVGVTDLSEISSILCDSTTGQRNLQVHPAVLFEKINYYFPNYDQRSSITGIRNTSGAFKVEPMFAIKSYVAEMSVETTQDLSKMGDDNAFELLLGNNGYSDGSNGDSTAHYSYYKVYNVTIKLKGSPPITNGTNAGGAGGDGLDGEGVGGSGIGSSGLTGQGGDEGSGDSSGRNIVEGIGGAASSEALNSAAVEEGGSSVQASATDSSEGEVDETQSEKRWQVFEMMSASSDNFEIEYSNPFEKYAIPLLILIAALGGVSACSRMLDEEGIWKKPKILENFLSYIHRLLRKDPQASMP